MEYRIPNNTVIYLGEPDEAPDGVAVVFEMTDLPAGWAPITPTAVAVEGLDLRVTVDTKNGPHTLILPSDSLLIANSIKNFAQVIIAGTDPEGGIALEVALPVPNTP